MISIKIIRYTIESQLINAKRSHGKEVRKKVIELLNREELNCYTIKDEIETVGGLNKFLKKRKRINASDGIRQANCNTRNLCRLY